MSANNLPAIIRNAKLGEYETIGKLDRECYINTDRHWRLVCGMVDPATWLQWLWIDGAKKGVLEGHDKVLVLERTDTSEIIGVAWYRVYSEANPPSQPVSFPEGMNTVEDKIVNDSRNRWLENLVQEHGKILFKLSRPRVIRRQVKSLTRTNDTDVSEFVIGPQYQGTGLGKRLMEQVIEEARTQGLNVFLSAASGKESSRESPSSLSYHLHRFREARVLRKVWIQGSGKVGDVSSWDYRRRESDIRLARHERQLMMADIAFLSQLTMMLLELFPSTQ